MGLLEGDMYILVSAHKPENQVRTPAVCSPAGMSHLTQVLGAKQSVAPLPFTHYTLGLSL